MASIGEVLKQNALAGIKAVRAMPEVTTATGPTYVVIETDGQQHRMPLRSFIEYIAPLIGINVEDLPAYNQFDGIFDATTGAEYADAIANAAVGEKRLAAANALVAALSPDHRLRVFRNATQIFQVDYVAAVTVVDDGTNVGLSLGTVESVSAIQTADINSGIWTFRLQGGTGYAREVIGSVGPPGSGADLILSTNTAAGMGFTQNVQFIIPRAIDGL